MSWLDPPRVKVYMTSLGTVITSLDDVPDCARLAARQLFLFKWYQAVALAPFIIVLIIRLKLFPNSHSKLSMSYLRLFCGRCSPLYSLC